MKKIYFVICGEYTNFKNLKISYISKITWVLFIIYGKYDNKGEKYFKKKNQLKPNVPSWNLAASYSQRWALCSNCPANV